MTSLIVDTEMPLSSPSTPRRSKKSRHRPTTIPDPPSSSKKKRQSSSTSPKSRQGAKSLHVKTSPATTPKSSTKKNNTDSVSSRTRSTNAVHTDHNQYVKIHPNTEDATIKSMSKDNVLQEIMKIARNHKITISTETFAKAGKALLIRRAIAFKRLSSPTKSKKKYLLVHY